MGTAAIPLRLARRNLRHRPWQALLLLVTLTIATGTMGLALSVYGSGDAPWDRVWRATDGFHVLVGAYHAPDEPGDAAVVAEQRQRALAAAQSPEVVAVGGPWTHLYGNLAVPGGYEDLTAEVRDPGRSPVDQPLVTEGEWLGSGDGVVLEHGLARALHVGPGDTITVNGRSFPVRGVAMTVSRGLFPLSRPAQAWVTPDTAAQMQAVGLTEEGFEMQLRLRDPDASATFAAAHPELSPEDTGSVVAFTETWQARRAASHSDLDIVAGTLAAAAVLLALLATATAAVLVVDRMAAQTRQVGTLKAVGVTPRQVVAALLAEHLAVALLAVVLGLGIGRLLAPRMAASSVTLLGPPETPPLTPGRVALIAAVAVGVVLLGTVRPALRGIRRSTLASLATGPRPPRRPGPIARVVAAAGLPLPAVLGLRSAWRRPSRLLTNGASLTLGVATVVVALGLRPSLGKLHSEPADAGHAASGPGIDPLYAQVRTIVLVTAALLLVLATINAVIVAAFAARDSARNHAVLRAVGATPRQTTTALIVSQLGASALAVVLGIPLGLGLWKLMDGGDLPEVPVPAPHLVLLAVLVPLAFAALVAVPARRQARRPVAPVLAEE
ncbi:MAG TPA: ABC transporter permease [Acidimicrobiales bacterium]